MILWGYVMPDKNEPVDGYTDNLTKEKMPSHGETAGSPGSPDPGEPKGGQKPMDPDEYARMRKEAQEENSDQERKR